MEETDFLDRARAHHAAARGALRHPERPRAAPALALRRRAREGRARRPGRGRAARRLRPPPGRGAAAAAAARAGRRRRPRRRGSRGRSRARRAPGGSPTCSAAAATRSACCAWWRSPTPRRAPRCSAAGGRPGEAERRAPRARARRARRRARPRPARAGALPGHAHVPAGRDPALQRQDVDGGRPRAARAVPRPRADALRGAHPGAARVRPRAGKRLHRKAMARLLPPRDRQPPEARLRHPLRRLAAGVAGRGGRAPLRARLAARASWSTRRRSARLVDEHRARPRRPQGRPLLPARALGVAPRLRRGAGAGAA